MSEPTKQEILEKYRHLIDSDDFEVLKTDKLPSPEETHKDGAYLVFLGKLKGCYILLRRTTISVIALIVLAGEIEDGISAINRWSTFAYTELTPLVSTALEHLSETAIEYQIVTPAPSWPHHDEPLPMTPAIVTTTTTTPPPEPPVVELHSGSGLVPHSPSWKELA